MHKHKKTIKALLVIALIQSILFVIIILMAGVAKAESEVQQTEELGSPLAPGTYVFVSFSINKESLHSYFKEAEAMGAKLVIRGLVGQKHGRNRFAQTKAKIQEAKINVDINSNLFEQLDIKQVPAIAVINIDGSARKIYGHISLKKALEMMDADEVIK